MIKYIFLFLALQQIEGQQKLHVEVLYESLCPDSLKFITQQLYPASKKFAPYIDLKLTPLGKSSSLPNGDFVCQHGPRECQGNKIQSCVLAAVSDQIAQVEYVNCFMKSFKKEPVDNGQCSSAVGINYEQIEQCYSSPIGTNLQLTAEEH